MNNNANARKPILILDITNICHGYRDEHARSGIYFTSVNILKELCRLNAFELYLYAESADSYYIRPAVKNILRDTSCVKFCPQNIFYVLKEKFWIKKREAKRLRKPLLNFLYLQIANVFNFLRKIYNPFYAQKLQKFLNRKYAYLLLGLPENNIISKHKKCKSFYVLYDIIPIVFKERIEGCSEYANEFFIKQFSDAYSRLRKEDSYFSISEYTKQDLIKTFPDKFHDNNVHTVLLDTNFKMDNKNVKDKTYLQAKYNIPADKKYVFSICAISPRKNILFAIRNFTAFIKKHNIENLYFVIAGKPRPYFKDVFEKCLEETGQYRKYIISLDYVADEDIETLYRRALIFIILSLYEGFGMPLLEAMKCACPVISSNATSLPEVSGGAALLINPKIDEELISAFEKMYFNDNFRREFIKKGLARAKSFSWENAAKTIAQTILKNYEK